MEAGVSAWLAAGLAISHTVHKTERSVQLYTETRGRASVDSQWPLSLVPKSLSVRWDREGGGRDRPPFCVVFPSLVWLGSGEGSAHWGRGLLIPSMPQGRCFRRGGQHAGGVVVWWEISPEERVSPSGSEVRV